VSDRGSGGWLTMYETRFGLRVKPFPATPDCACYYPATSHEQALAQLLQAVQDNEGFALLVAGPGMGKTLLCHCLIERLGPDVVSAFLTNSHFSDRSALLQAILYDLSLSYEGGEQALRLRLMDFLLNNYGAGKRTVLLVDEAQHLTPDLLEELRLVGNLESRQGKAFQVILAAQPGILETLEKAELAAVNQRLAVRQRLEPLGVEEAADYILHHLRAAGGRPESIVAEDALPLLARGARGIPRLINRVVHQALKVAHEADLCNVDAEVALEALTLLGLEVEDIPAEGKDLLPVPGAQEPLPVEISTEELPVIPLSGAVVEVGAAADEAACRLFETPSRPA
jgi:type II secretory pathway predicted ATPase ExeA